MTAIGIKARVKMLVPWKIIHFHLQYSDTFLENNFYIGIWDYRAYGREGRLYAASATVVGGAGSGRVVAGPFAEAERWRAEKDRCSRELMVIKNALESGDLSTEEQLSDATDKLRKFRTEDNPALANSSCVLRQRNEPTTDSAFQTAKFALLRTYCSRSENATPYQVKAVAYKLSESKAPS